MARIARAEVFDRAEVAIAHVISRTGLFGIDLICFSILSKHHHLILRSRPDVVKTLDDTEVARRWLMLCPHRKDADGGPLESTERYLELSDWTAPSVGRGQATANARAPGPDPGSLGFGEPGLVRVGV